MSKPSKITSKKNKVSFPNGSMVVMDEHQLDALTYLTAELKNSNQFVYGTFLDIWNELYEKEAENESLIREYEQKSS